MRAEASWLATLATVRCFLGGCPAKWEEPRPRRGAPAKQKTAAPLGAASLSLAVLQSGPWSATAPQSGRHSCQRAYCKRRGDAGCICRGKWACHNRRDKDGCSLAEWLYV